LWRNFLGEYKDEKKKFFLRYMYRKHFSVSLTLIEKRLGKE